MKKHFVSQGFSAQRCFALCVMACFIVTAWAGPLSAESITGRVTGNKLQMWAFYPYEDNQYDFTAMWPKRGSDVDIVVFVEGDEGEIYFIGIGFSTTKHFERVSLGLYGSGERTYVALMHMGAGGTQYQFNIQCTVSEEIYKTTASLQSLGEFAPLDQSPSNENALAQKVFEKIRRLKTIQ